MRRNTNDRLVRLEPGKPRGAVASSGRTRLAMLALVCALTPCLVRAQTVPLGFSAGPGVNVEHDSNFFNAAEGSGVPIAGETLVTASLLAALHEVYSRQDVSVTGSLGRVHYLHNHQYDFTQENLAATLSSNLPFDINTTVSVNRANHLARFSDLGNANRDVISNTGANATIDFPVWVDWRGVFGGSAAHTRNSATIYESQNLNTADINGGVRYQPRTGNHIDLLVRNDHGSYPQGSGSPFISPGYRERGADLNITWTFDGASTARGRAGYLKRNNDPLVYPTGCLVFPVFCLGPNAQLSRDFSGPAYDLSYTWQATAATQLNLSASRSTGAAGDNNYLSAQSKSFRIAPSYQLSSKIQLGVSADWSKRDYFTYVLDIVEGLPLGTAREDTSHSVGLNGSWSPWRWLKATLDAHRDRRDSNQAGYSFTGNVVSLGVQGSFY